jgi:hypothetical protein
LVESSDASAAVILQPILGTTGAMPVPPEVPQATIGTPVFPEALTAVVPKPVPADEDTSSPNEANDPAEPHSSDGLIELSATGPALHSPPLATRMIARLKLLQRTDLPAAQEDQLLRDQERDLAALEVEIERLSKIAV